MCSYARMGMSVYSSTDDVEMRVGAVILFDNALSLRAFRASFN